MEQSDRRYDLVPVGRENRMLPVISPAKSLRVSNPNRGWLVKFASWVAAEPAIRLGVATLAFTAGAFLSKRLPAGLPIIPSRIQQREEDAGEWIMTGVGLSIQSDGQQVSAWSITQFRRRR